MSRTRVAIALLALAVVGTVAACSSGAGSDDDTRAPATPADGVMLVEEPAKVAETAAVGAPEAVPPELELAPQLDLAALPTIGPRIIQNASLTLGVEKGDFDETVRRARSIALGLGGFVASSTSSKGLDGRLVRGTLVVRVPERSYDRAMQQLSDLGKVEGLEESGQDVSQQFVDLEARARHLEAVERQLLTFLEKTTTIGDALVVQDRLNQVQLQLEEIRGQLRYLDDQTSFATISLSIAEHGVAVAKKDDGGWGIADAWRAAARGFVKVIGGAFVGLATAAPILLALAVAFFGGRYLLRRRRSQHRAEFPVA